MKLVAYIIAKRNQHTIDIRFFYMTPIMCPKTHGESFDIKVKHSEIIFEILFSTLGLIFIYNYLLLLLTEYTFLLPLRPYILLAFIYIFTLFIGANFRCLSLVFNFKSSKIHNRPYLSKSIHEFWTLRWNIWIRNWLHYIGKYLFPQNLKLRQFSIFMISGLFHEAMVNLPYYLYTGKFLFGTMLAYFLIQYLGVLLDKNFLKPYKKLRYIFMWLCIFIPAPLFMNEALLKFFGFF